MLMVGRSFFWSLAGPAQLSPGAVVGATEPLIAMASREFRSSSGHRIGILGLVACAWSLSVETRSLATSIQPVGLDPLQLRPADLQSLNLEELKAIKGKLWRELKDIRLPPPTSFTAFGQEYKLPYSVKETSLKTPSDEMLEYLFGFFAGDGCVK